MSRVRKSPRAFPRIFPTVFHSVLGVGVAACRWLKYSLVPTLVVSREQGSCVVRAPFPPAQWLNSSGADELR